MEVLLGMMGALLAMGSFFAGLALGRRTPEPAPRVAALEEQEARRLMEGQEAFRTLQNYSAERAYGMLRNEEVNT